MNSDSQDRSPGNVIGKRERCRELNSAARGASGPVENRCRIGKSHGVPNSSQVRSRLVAAPFVAAPFGRDTDPNADDRQRHSRLIFEVGDAAG
jgi:hypothetical protein